MNFVFFIAIIAVMLLFMYFFLWHTKNGRIISAVILTIFAGYAGIIIGYSSNASELGSILAVATMGVFILLEIQRKKPD